MEKTETKMPVERKQYTLTQRPQLIDLNQSYKNFRLQFQVVCKNPETQFQAVVLTQEQLDTLNTLSDTEMKIARGKIGGTIVADNDKYQNYFLVLKNYGETEIEVEVMTVLDEIPPSSKPQVADPDEKNTSSGPVNTEPESIPSAPQPSPSPSPVIQKRSFFRSPLFWGLLLLLVVLGGVWYYHRYLVSSPKSIDTLSTVTATTTLVETKEGGSGESIHEAAASAVPVAVTTTKKRSNTKHQQLYNKLQEIA